MRNANMTVVMHEGRIAEVGQHATLLTRNGMYAALVRAQQVRGTIATFNKATCVQGGLTPLDRDLAPRQQDYVSQVDGQGAGPSATDGSLDVGTGQVSAVEASVDEELSPEVASTQTVK